MSSKLVINKDFYYRAQLYNYKNQYRVNKLIQCDLYIPTEFRQFVLSTKNNSKFALRSKIHNRCLITGRTKAVYSYLKLTRMMFKNLAVKGYLSGIRKYSW
jgi:ribosomal protein S14